MLIWRVYLNNLGGQSGQLQLFYLQVLMSWKCHYSHQVLLVLRPRTNRTVRQKTPCVFHLYKPEIFLHDFFGLSVSEQAAKHIFGSKFQVKTRQFSVRSLGKYLPLWWAMVWFCLFTDVTVLLTDLPTVRVPAVVKNERYEQEYWVSQSLPLPAGLCVCVSLSILVTACCCIALLTMTLC